MKYKVLTEKAVFDENRDFEDENYLAELVAEQDEKLAELGYEYDDLVLVRHGNGQICFDHIEDSIECLALKDCADLVRFENGNIGYVGYYNGFSTSKNCFEIVCKWSDIPENIRDLYDCDEITAEQIAKLMK